MKKLWSLVKPLTPWKVAFGVIAVLGLYAVVLRFTHGLGAVSNLSDKFPWGLWIAFDLLVGVGLAAGGFVIAATVHIFKIEKYEPIARPTILTAFLGYLLVIVALLIDVGRPWNMWHPIVMWNPHSVMFEVAWCVMLYTAVLALEFSPLVFKRFGLEVPLRIVRKIYLPLVIVGVLLSTMHQSSLGTMYVIAASKLHPLLYTPMLPVFFWISAIAAGLAMTIFESYMSWRAFGKRLEADLLQGMARVIVVVLAVYGLMRMQVLVGRGVLGMIFEVSTESALWWGEMGLGVVLPMVLLALPRIRRSDQGLFFGAMLTIMGFIINRLNVAITGMAATSGTNYFPSFLEIMITVNVVALGFVLFALAVKYFPVFEEEEGHAHVPAPAVHEPQPELPPALSRFQPAVRGSVVLALWGFLLVGAFAVGYTAVRRPAAPAAEADGLHTRVAQVDLKLPADYLFPKGESSPGGVAFSHATHVDPAKPDCVACHAEKFRLTSQATPVSGQLSQERIHEGDLCGSCHDGKTAFSYQDGCDICHRQ